MKMRNKYIIISMSCKSYGARVAWVPDPNDTTKRTLYEHIASN